jgi:(2Fe-2S) ferredoxin
MMTNNETSPSQCWAAGRPADGDAVLALLARGAAGGEAAPAPEHLAVLRRERVELPTIYVGTGTCGLGAGAGETIKTVRAWLQEKKLNADVVEVGCIGLCASEPILDVQLPGRTRVSFESVTEKNAVRLLETVLGGVIPEGGCLGQFRAARLEPWDGVPWSTSILSSGLNSAGCWPIAA